MIIIIDKKYNNNENPLSYLCSLLPLGEQEFPHQPRHQQQIMLLSKESVCSEQWRHYRHPAERSSEII